MAALHEHRPRRRPGPRAWVGLLLVALAGCGLPRDPMGTLQEIEGGTMKVGLTEQPPWVVRTPDGPAGVEVELIKELADELGADVDWQWGGTDDLLEALEHFQIDIVVAGLTNSSPWSGRVGFTRPYYDETYRVGIPPGMLVPETIEGLEVAVPEGSALATHAARQGLKPVRVHSLTHPNRPVAAPEWKLNVWRYQAVGEPIHVSRHVMAVPPGENGWLMRLHRHLAERRASMPDRLAEAWRALEDRP